MKSALPLVLLGAAILAGFVALVIREPVSIPEDNGISGGIVIFLAIYFSTWSPATQEIPRMTFSMERG